MNSRRARPVSDYSSAAADILPLFEFTQIVNSSLDLNFILNTVLFTTMGKMLVTKGMILLQRKKGIFEIVAAKGVDSALIHRHIEISHAPMRMVDLRTSQGLQKKWSVEIKGAKQSILFPIIAQKILYGYLSLGERVANKKYSKQDLQLVESILNVAASSLEKALMVEQLHDANRSLDKKIQELNTLFDLSKEYNTVFEPGRLVKLLTYSLLGQVGVNKYSIYLCGDEGFCNVANKFDFECDGQTLNELAGLKTSISIDVLLKRKKNLPVVTKFQQGGVKVIVPMFSQNVLKGIILLGERVRGGEYRQSDLEFISSLANLAMISIENARLFRDALEKQRMEQELNIAREIQMGLLPRSLPSVQDFEIAAMSLPSKQVGGDYYDVIEREDGRIVFAIGDVSGKGTPAALLMANIQAVLRTIAPLELDLSLATARINDLIWMNTDSGRFITFFWGILDPAKRELQYINAGHNPPLMLRANGSIEKLDIGGIILGIMKTTTPYEVGTIRFGRDDMLYLFTDGVSEAMDAGGIDYTEDRLESFVAGHRQLSAKGLVDAVQADVLKFIAGAPQSDDITMLALQAL
jgi:sigma-B regulation protein RsbU (phosphoserine phosphatase)